MNTLKQNLTKFATVDNIIDLTTSALAGLVVLGVALMGIVLSYNALYDLAHLSGVIHPRLIWLWPFMLDSVAVGASIFIMWAEWRQQPAHYAWGLLIGFTVASLIFNTLHANYEALVTLPYFKGTISSFVAGLPPVAAALTLHLFVTLLRDILKRLSLVATVGKLRQDRDNLAADLGKLTGQIERQQDKLKALKSDITTQKRVNIQDLAEAKQAKIDERRADVLSMLQDGMSQDEVKEAAADKWNVTARTIGRDIKALNGQARMQ